MDSLALSTRSRLNRIALWCTCILVLVPTTLGTLFCSLMGLGRALELLSRSNWRLNALLMLAALCAGWFGVVTLWRLFVGLVRGRPPSNPPAVWMGLMAGSAVSLSFIVAMNDVWAIVIFGWPLLAALHLGTEFSKTYPLTLEHAGDRDNLP